ncbi:DUF2461 domain-containing protein [Dactylosporangium matsuzakiense]|uniref:DUF2461 domain-containing protein n=1 Tax=Dactylosporangium matsuzakiense TaxID=53360 RepID=UPI0021C2FEC3|nr:DUF2461 domain-containing protein [Dactylosporangium matsuzakiense]UWZ42264.1 DUF2461 family protein [Dactylosporangium matsuzakiense]
MLIKLARPRVLALIEDGTGVPFAPAGRTFREWLAVPDPDPMLWRALLSEALTFAGGTAPAGGDGFAGFGTEGFAFLAGLERDNSKAFADQHRAVYRDALAEPSKAFVVAAGARLAERVAPGVRGEPRVGGSLFRLANDLRFQPGRPPYKTHLDLVFWAGVGGPRTDPGLVIRLTAAEVLLGAGVPALSGARLRRYRECLRDADRVTALDRAVEPVLAAGGELSEPSRVRVPAGIEPAGPAARYAVRDGLYVTRRQPLPSEVTTPAFVGWCAEALVPFGPLLRWLVAAVATAGPAVRTRRTPPAAGTR